MKFEITDSVNGEVFNVSVSISNGKLNCFIVDDGFEVTTIDESRRNSLMFKGNQFMCINMPRLITNLHQVKEILELGFAAKLKQENGEA